MTKTLLKTASPGLLTAIVKGDRRPPLSAVVVQIRKRWPVLSVPA